MRTLELLSPAKNLECGIAAIDHGADAVYIGAKRFGARASAGNSLDDIACLCQYAHRYGARVYVTVNTILYDDELEATRELITQLGEIGADAVLVQDMALLSMPHPTLEYHASTQTDNRSAEKVRWLLAQGFSRVVLARELSIREIAAIHEQVPSAELEVFVHGALCVSYSGLCYASHHCFGRSANRGECAQFCRMKFDLEDADGNTLQHQRHLLSLKDMCQIDHLEQLAEAGASSFKIEGRLKDINYVKNVTAAYSQRLDSLIARHPDKYCRASTGRVDYTFSPDLRKTFNRGYTTYFAEGRQPHIASFDTPKAMGEYVGVVKELRGMQSFNVAGTARFANGDGLCFLNDKRELEGFRVNRVEGNRIFPLKMPPTLRPGIRLYRNNSQEFEHLLARPSAERKVDVRMHLQATADGFSLTISDALAAATNSTHVPAADDTASGVTVSLPFEHQMAQTPQHDNIVRQLSKLGGTPYRCSEVEMDEAFNYFIPSSLLSELRRRAITEFERSHNLIKDKRVGSSSANSHEDGNPSDNGHEVGNSSANNHSDSPLPSYDQPYFYNIANREATAFYRKQGLTEPAEAFELRKPRRQPLIMQCRHCLRHAMGACAKHGGEQAHLREPLYLKLSDGRRFRLEFDCRACQMNVYAQDS